MHLHAGTPHVQGCSLVQANKANLRASSCSSQTQPAGLPVLQSGSVKAWCTLSGQQCSRQQQQ